MGQIKAFYHDIIEENMRNQEPIHKYEGIQCVIVDNNGKYEIISSEEYNNLDIKLHIHASGFYNELETIIRRTKHL